MHEGEKTRVRKWGAGVLNSRADRVAAEQRVQREKNSARLLPVRRFSRLPEQASLTGLTRPNRQNPQVRAKPGWRLSDHTWSDRAYLTMLTRTDLHLPFLLMQLLISSDGRLRVVGTHTRTLR